MDLQDWVDLSALHTFGVPARARRLLSLREIGDAKSLADLCKAHKVLILGGGSNLLFVNDFNGLVLSVEIPGREVVEERNGDALVAAGAGEHWHEFVRWCVARDLGGLENLSLIPGKVGAGPIQNIGAYGVELRDCFHHLEAVDLAAGRRVELGPQDCRFGYRDSRFKQDWRGRFLITRVFFQLTVHDHQLHTSYGDIQQELADRRISDPGIDDLSRVVMAIRQRKLPDPASVGNAGSFFKNPVVSPEKGEEIRKKYPRLPAYSLPDGRIKIPAGWLIDQCGWKGKRVSHTGCYAQQALVIVNYGGATGREILNFSRQVAQSVHAKFGIELEPEVNVVEG